MTFLSPAPVRTLCALALAATAAAGVVEGPGPETPAAFSRFQKLVIVHALLSTLAFALILPLGALLARYLRTSRPWWYSGHWIAQLAIGGPVVVAGLGLGFAAKAEYGDTISPSHVTLGKVILGLYIIQCAMGAVIHYFKPASAARRRPPQNYLHAVIGLLLVGLGMYQAHSGYAEEWPRLLRYGELPESVNRLWIAWCVILPVAYAGGLALLPKQYRQEADGRSGNKAHELRALKQEGTSSIDMPP
ncbi:hypothetical protein B0H15DRAFT_993831 [Mycena belliarum]|uniref:Cytochrome b561 domain-containing protein n=1 Tax=Mycena belliarum TaxID=1033014 RepID=A0AAD6U2C7_9AGAR|nr:hypothetical protein B0H15DRAFT_993831 [Mycena belliae]